MITSSSNILSVPGEQLSLVPTYPQNNNHCYSTCRPEIRKPLKDPVVNETLVIQSSELHSQNELAVFNGFPLESSKHNLIHKICGVKGPQPVAPLPFSFPTSALFRNTRSPAHTHDNTPVRPSKMHTQPHTLWS